MVEVQQELKTAAVEARGEKNEEQEQEQEQPWKEMEQEQPWKASRVCEC